MSARIRQVTTADAAALVVIYAPCCTSSIISFEETAPTVEEMAVRITRISTRFPWLVLDDGGTIGGYAYASPHRERAAYRWSVDVTVYVDARYPRRGVGRALYAALFALLAQQGFHRAFAGVALPNPGSEGLHEAVGFVEVGVYRDVGYKFGAWRDVRWYQRTLGQPTEPPGEPIPITDLVDTPGWQEALATGLTFFRQARFLDLPDLEATVALGRRLGGLLFPGAVVALVGALGAGKTQLARAIAEGLAVPDARVVTSPTFVLIQEYLGGRLPIYHFDVYRLAGETAFADLGAHEYLEGDGVCLIEWADRVPGCLPGDHLRIRLEPTGLVSRRAVLEATGPRHQALLASLSKVDLLAIEDLPG